MTQDRAAEEVEARPIDIGVALRFLQMSGGFWYGPMGRAARLITVALAAALVLKLAVDVGMNRWNRWFFDALERRDAAAALSAVVVFVGIVAGTAAVGVLIVRTREQLQVQWRAWLTGRLLDGWLSREGFARQALEAGSVANPEYRISDDVRMATEPLVDFAIGLFTALLAFVTFVGILWSVGGSLTLRFGAVTLTIPCFMVLGAIAYGVIASSLVPIVGRRLSSCVAARNEAEARFRSELIRVRENADAISLGGGEQHARASLGRSYGQVVRRWLEVVRQHGNVTWVMNANAAIIPVAPLVMAAPKYLAGELTLGEVMQLASAFAQVQVAIGWLADNYWRVAEWFASARRVVEVGDGAHTQDEAIAPGRPVVAVSRDAIIRARGLSLLAPGGGVLLRDVDIALSPGDRVLVHGEGGTGKSVLARGLAGLWPWGEGRLDVPARLSTAILSPQPYVPDGTLHAATVFPLPEDARGTAAVAEALSAVGLERFVPRLGQTGRWQSQLSLSERQRLAVARTLLQEPGLVVVDEALSALDIATQAELVAIMGRRLPAAVIVEVSGRPADSASHTRSLLVRRDTGGSATVAEVEHPPARKKPRRAGRPSSTGTGRTAPALALEEEST